MLLSSVVYRALPIAKLILKKKKSCILWWPIVYTFRLLLVLYKNRNLFEFM